MKILITGAAGFAGTCIARSIRQSIEGVELFGIDNLMRKGAETNLDTLRALGVHFVHGDIRCASDFESLPVVDWVLDAAANPSVLAGTGGGSSRQLFEHNLTSLINVLEYCKRHGAGVILISSSRVYSIPALLSLPLLAHDNAFVLDHAATLPAGISPSGIGVDFSTAPPVSLYGSSKLAAESVALEYADAFQFPVWINRCGVLAGAGQFGTPGQGIFTYWVHAHHSRRALRYIGFDGTGKQVRDVFHPLDLTTLLIRQMQSGRAGGQRVYTCGGGPANAVSLAQWTERCNEAFGPHIPAIDTTPRAYDIPWMIMDNSGIARDFQWNIQVPVPALFEEIAQHARTTPGWLRISGL